MSNYHQLIERDPTKRFGQAIVKGTRICVYDVLSWFADGVSEEDIMVSFPELKQAHIRACLAYAADKMREGPIHSN